MSIFFDLLILCCLIGHLPRELDVKIQTAHSQQSMIYVANNLKNKLPKNIIQAFK